jgi:hypothetical protein
MDGWPVMTGVPAAGHVARNGYLHPGAEAICSKAPCAEDREPGSCADVYFKEMR